MDVHVMPQLLTMAKFLITEITTKRFLSSMCADMTTVASFVGEWFPTVITFVIGILNSWHF